MYATARAGTTRGSPMASNWSNDMLPFVSVRRIWSIERPISSPATALPAARWDSISLRVRLLPTLAQRRERAALRPDVLAARPDQAVVVVLLDDVRRPARDAARGDHGREEIHGDPERVEERRRVEVDVRDQLLRRLDPLVELHRHLVPLELARLAARLLPHAPADRGPRGARPPPAAAEPHEPPLLGERLLGEGAHVRAVADLRQRAH